MINANSYFDGRVQSLGFKRHGRRLTVGVIEPGEFYFGTDGPERMTVVSGELYVRQAANAAWIVYPTGTSFELPGNSGFDVRTTEPAAYVCEFL